jgi:hypothetical protein
VDRPDEQLAAGPQDARELRDRRLELDDVRQDVDGEDERGRGVRER